MPRQKRRLTPPGFYTGADIENVATPSPYFSPTAVPGPAIAPDFAFDPSTPQTGTAMAAEGYIPPHQTQPNVYTDVYLPRFESEAENLRSALSAPQPTMKRRILSSLIPMSSMRAYASGDFARQQRINDAAQQYGLTNDIINTRFNIERQPLTLENLRSTIAENYAHADYLKSQSGRVESPAEARARRHEELLSLPPGSISQGEAARYELTGQMSDPLLLAQLQETMFFHRGELASQAAGHAVTARGQDISEATRRDIFKAGEDEKRRIQREGAEAQNAALDANLDRMASAAQELMNHPGLPGITGVFGVFPNIPSGDAANAKALYDNVTSQSGISALQNMRDLSKSGGALGQVSEGEHVILRSYISALGRRQSPEEFKKNLQKLLNYVAETKARHRAMLDRIYSDTGYPAPAGAPTAAPAPRAPAPAALPAPAPATAPLSRFKKWESEQPQ